MPLIRMADWPHPVEAGRLRILEAALDAGVPFPHGCGSGECGSCKCRLLEGEVQSDRFSPDALSPAEQAQGLILACRARPVGDVRVQWLSSEAPLPMVKLDTTVRSVVMASHDVAVLSVQLRAGDRFEFRAGQFAKLRIGKLPARSYSMASAPGDPALAFHVRVLEGGAVSPAIARQLRPGDTVELRGPFGDAHWSGPHRTPVLLLAGGTGLAPMLSILDAALAQGQEPGLLHLYHGVRTAADLYADAQLVHRAQALGLRYVPVLADDPTAHGARTGMLHEAVAQDFPDLSLCHLYVAGPPPMVEAVRELARRRGAAPERIRADAFHAAQPERRSLWERISGWAELS